MSVPRRIDHEIRDLAMVNVQIHAKMNRFEGNSHIEHPGMIKNIIGGGINTINPQIWFKIFSSLDQTPKKQNW